MATKNSLDALRTETWVRLRSYAKIGEDTSSEDKDVRVRKYAHLTIQSVRFLPNKQTYPIAKEVL